MSEAGFVHRFVPGTGASALVLLHGTGGDEHSLLPLGMALVPGAAMLAPRGQVMEGPYPRFFRRIGEGIFDQDDLRRRTDDLAAFVEGAVARYQLGGRRIVAVGFSNGANIAASLLLRRPGLIRDAILFRAMLPFEPEIRPALTGTRVWLGAGRGDPIVPQASVERLAAILGEAGGNVSLNWREGGHQLEEGEVADARRWLEGGE
jgi:predicted esterase